MKTKSKNLAIKTLVRICAMVVFFVVLSGILFGQNKKENPIEISFIHNTDKIQGWFYKAVGNGPFSTVILLQGSVGNDGDLFNLGKSLAKEGYNAITYSYPGSWRSEGFKTDRAALGSIQSAIKYIISKSTIQMFEIDTTDIILLGYSYGGGMALLGSACDNRVKKVISIAGGDLSIRAQELKENPQFRQNFQQRVEYLLSNPSMVRGTSGEEYVETMIKNKDEFDIKKQSEKLAKKKVLLIAGSYDNMVNNETHIIPLYHELQLKWNSNVLLTTLETDHGFANVQTELIAVIIKWLKKKE